MFTLPTGQWVREICYSLLTKYARSNLYILNTTRPSSDIDYDSLTHFALSILFCVLSLACLNSWEQSGHSTSKVQKFNTSKHH